MVADFAEVFLQQFERCKKCVKIAGSRIEKN
jgi:hypothetical protein